MTRPFVESELLVCFICDDEHMDPLVWNFRLDGDNFDVRTVQELFSEEASIRMLDDGCHHLQIKLPFPSSDAQAAQATAEELLCKLNGIAQILHGNHRNLRITGVSWQETLDGARTSIIMLAGIETRARLGFPTIGNGSHPTAAASHDSMGDRFLNSADKDEHFERALYLYGGLIQDWRGLFMVVEAAEDGNGGETGLIKKLWVPDRQIKAFKATANSFKAIGLHARHGSVSLGVPRPEQTFDEARTMVRTILECWGKELGMRGTGSA